MNPLQHTLTFSSLLLALVACWPASAEEPNQDRPTKNDSSTISAFAQMLDQSRNDLDGCQGEWRGRSGGSSMAQIMCRRFDGPGDFKGVGTTVVLIGERISMIATQLESSEVGLAREKFETLRRQAGATESGCKLSEESDKHVKYECDGHHISISYSQAAGQWNTSLTLARN